MFGMGFMEIFLIAIVAIIALGPEKLPTAMVEIAKFIKKFKSGVEDAKSTLDNELNISEMKEEAAKYKAQIENAKSTLNVKENMDLGLDQIINDDVKSSKKESKKKKKKKQEAKEEAKEEKIQEAQLVEEKETNEADSINKFKIDVDDFENTEDKK